jgi:type VI secretion system protein ImpG
VLSVDSVSSTDPATGLVTEYQPFYSYRHAGRVAMPRAFWYPSRRPSPLKDDRGTDVHLSFVDLDYHPHLPAESAVLVKATCCNRDLPSRLQQAGEGLTFELEQVAPLAAVRCVRRPTATLRPPLRRGAHWRLMSHLNLNHLSLEDERDGRLALQEVLSLYDFSDPSAGEHHAAVTSQLVEGLLSVRSRRVVGRTGGPTSSGFARGLEVTVEFDASKYVGTGVYLFACVLERFLGLYVSLNSFTQLVARTKQQEEPLKRWPPRAGEHLLL